MSWPEALVACVLTVCLTVVVLVLFVPTRGRR